MYSTGSKKLFLSYCKHHFMHSCLSGWKNAATWKWLILTSFVDTNGEETLVDYVPHLKCCRLQYWETLLQYVAKYFSAHFNNISSTIEANVHIFLICSRDHPGHLSPVSHQEVRRHPLSASHPHLSVPNIFPSVCDPHLEVQIILQGPNHGCTQSQQCR